MKFREYEIYRSYYCGLCHILKDRYGRRGQLLLNYDMTFAAILLGSLYEPETKLEQHRCLPHPAVKHPERTNAAVSYAADMTVLLAWHKAMDDWKDDKNPAKLALAFSLKPAYAKIRKRYPRQAICVEDCIRKLSVYEKENEHDLDRVSALTGMFMAEILDWKCDEWSADLKGLGFYLGKYIYLADAFVDLESDIRHHEYNVWESVRGRDPRGFADTAEAMLVDVCGCAARYFERLPLVENVGILRNILYAGLWLKYTQAREKMRKNGDKAERHTKTS